MIFRQNVRAMCQLQFEILTVNIRLLENQRKKILFHVVNTLSLEFIEFRNVGKSLKRIKAADRLWFLIFISDSQSVKILSHNDTGRLMFYDIIPGMTEAMIRRKT